MASMKKLSRAEKRIRKLKKLAGPRVDRARMFKQIRQRLREEAAGLRDRGN